MLPSSASQRVNLDGGTNNVHPGSFSLVGYDLRRQHEDWHEVKLTGICRPRTRPQFNGIDIIREADEFAMIHGLNKDQILIKKGALVYHDPDNGAGVEGLTPDELAALSDKSREKVNTFKLKGWTSYTCYMAIIL